MTKRALGQREDDGSGESLQTARLARAGLVMVMIGSDIEAHDHGRCMAEAGLETRPGQMSRREARRGDTTRRALSMPSCSGGQRRRAVPAVHEVRASTG